MSAAARAAEWERLKGVRRRGAPAPSRTPAAKGTPEAVVKVAAWGKSARSGAALAKYIAEGSEHVLTPELLRDENGRELTAEQAVDVMMKEWGLKLDSENLSPAARKVSPGERRQMPENERLQARQVAHLVVSWPKDFPINRGQAEAVAADLVQPFTDAGHRSLAVYHNDGGRPHVHLILQARSNETGRSLRIGPDELQALRQLQANLTREHTGHDMLATTREERAPLRHEIEQGAARLRERPARQQPTLLERQAPGWYTRHGYDYERRRTGAALPNPPAAAVAARLPAAPEKTEQQIDRWAQRFQHAETAKQRFKELAAENTRTAYWYANRRPEIFGQLRPGAVAPEAFGLTARTAPLPQEWAQQARAALARVQDADPRIGARRLEAAAAVRAQAVQQQRDATTDYMRRLLDIPAPTPAPERPRDQVEASTVAAIDARMKEISGERAQALRRLKEVKAPLLGRQTEAERKAEAFARQQIDRLDGETRRLAELRAELRPDAPERRPAPPWKTKDRGPSLLDRLLRRGATDQALAPAKEKDAARVQRERLDQARRKPTAQEIAKKAQQLHQQNTRGRGKGRDTGRGR